MAKWVRQLAGVAASALITAALASCSGSNGRASRMESPANSGEPTRIESSLVRVDDAGQVRDIIPVGPHPAVITASGQIWSWSFDDGTLIRVDPATGKATPVSIGEVAAFTSDSEDVWAAVDGNRIVRIDGLTGAVKTSFTVGSGPLFDLGDAGFLAVNEGSVWLTVPKLAQPDAPQALWQIDAKTGTVQTRIPIGVNPQPPLAEGPTIWMIMGAVIGPGALHRIDTRTRTSEPVPTGAFPWVFVRGANSLWVGHLDPREVWRLEPTTDDPIAKIPITTGEIRGIGYGGGVVWVTTETSLHRIDPATNTVTRTTETMSLRRDKGPTGVVFLDGSVWVSVE